MELYLSANGLCELGRIYRHREEDEEAERCFVLASRINPALIVPKYELFILYQALGKQEEMIETGKKIMTQPVKRESTVTLRIKAQVRKKLGESAE